MKKRRRKSGLSGTASEHSNRQARYLTMARDEIAQAGRQIQRGNCGDASDHLRRASEAIGGYNAESEWSDKPSQYAPDVKKNLRKTTDSFEERCMINFAK